MIQSGIITCKKCGGKFTWHEYNGGYPGGKDRESVCCPYCDEEAFSVVISGVVAIEKVEEPGMDETVATMTTLGIL